MNKKEAIAYAQITLDYMQSSRYIDKISPKTFGIEMKQAFKLYPRNIVTNIAEAKISAEEKINKVKKRSDIVGK